MTDTQDDRQPPTFDPLADWPLDNPGRFGWPVYLVVGALVLLAVGFVVGVPVGMILQGFHGGVGG